MSAILRELLRGLIGLLVAGLLAQATIFVPDRWQGPWFLYGLLVLSLAGAFLIGRRSRKRP